MLSSKTMPFLLSQNKKILIAAMTVLLLSFSTFMLFFDEVEDGSLNAKASVLHSSSEEAHH